MIEQLKIFTEALWKSVKTDMDFFAPILAFVERLVTQRYTGPADVDNALRYMQAIDDFWAQYRQTAQSTIFYTAPRLISLNENTIALIRQSLQKLKVHPPMEWEQPSASEGDKIASTPPARSNIFIGHGRSKLWARVQVFLESELGLDVLTYESDSRVSEQIISVLEGFLNSAAVAVLIMTAEDETAEGTIRARQNVIHEVGLFQGRLGFEKVIILKQDTVEPFTNIAGLQYINFKDNDIELAFLELQRKLKKLHLVP
jgi:predicted nucleotide-binding protein